MMYVNLVHFYGENLLILVVVLDSLLFSSFRFCSCVASAGGFHFSTPVLIPVRASVVCTLRAAYSSFSD
jgi:hypothetical protein